MYKDLNFPILIVHRDIKADTVAGERVRKFTQYRRRALEYGCPGKTSRFFRVFLALDTVARERGVGGDDARQSQFDRQVRHCVDVRVGQLAFEQLAVHNLSHVAIGELLRHLLQRCVGIFILYLFHSVVSCSHG